MENDIFNDFLNSDQHGTYRLVTGGADKALFFMSQTSDSNFERERWIQTSWPIHDIRGSQNAYVACGKFIQSYDMNGEVLRTFEFERASKLVFLSEIRLPDGHHPFTSPRGNRNK